MTDGYEFVTIGSGPAPTCAYAYKYAAFDGFRRIAAAGKESLDESARRLSANL
jgi:hypothetical protein